MNKYGKENISSCTGVGPVRLSLNKSFELEFEDLDTAGRKISCISCIVLLKNAGGKISCIDRAGNEIGCIHLQNTADFATSRILKLELQLETRLRTEPNKLHA